VKNVIIKNLAGIQTHGAEMLDPTAWIAECVAVNAWGKPERWVLHKDEPMAEAYDDADVLEEIIEEVSPAVEAVLDDQGVEVSPAIPAVTQKKVKLKAEYTVEIEDITTQVAQYAINADALAYLASTDWLVIREVDAGTPCPADIKAERAAARARIVR
jgi:hypothetical protein